MDRHLLVDDGVADRFPQRRIARRPHAERALRDAVEPRDLPRTKVECGQVDLGAERAAHDRRRIECVRAGTLEPDGEGVGRNLFDR